MCFVSIEACKPILAITQNKNDQPEIEHDMSPLTGLFSLCMLMDHKMIICDSKKHFDLQYRVKTAVNFAELQTYNK